METSSLRLGNMLYYNLFGDNEVVYIRGIGKNCIWLNDNGEAGPISVKYFEPILLTEEWLLKFGFVDIDKGDNDYITYTDSNHDYYLQIDVRRKDGKYSILDNSFDDLRDFALVDIMYVHQLQNLYFALTEEELTLKNK
jgi:hypothetical protein